MNLLLNTDVIETLIKFQIGYSERNTEKVDQFVEALFCEEEDVIIVGTGDGEFCRGQSEIKELIKIDWEYWGNFKLDLDNAVVSTHGDVSWVVCDGILQKALKPEVVYESCIKRIEKTFLLDESINDKMIQAMKLLSYGIHECNVGSEIARPVRFTAVLVKKENGWKFSNIHFSYAVAPPTDIKIQRTI